MVISFSLWTLLLLYVTLLRRLYYADHVDLAFSAFRLFHKNVSGIGEQRAGKSKEGAREIQQSPWTHWTGRLPPTCVPKGRVKLKNLLVSTTKAWPPTPAPVRC